MIHGSRVKRALLAIILVACVFGVQAQTPEPNQKRAAIQELLNLIGATATARAIFSSFIEQYLQALAKDTTDSFDKKNWPPAEKEKAKAMSRDFFAGLSQRLREEVPVRLQYEEKVNRLYVDAYDQYFTEAEIRELIAFYKSPVGQRFVAFAPAVSSALQQQATTEFQAPAMAVTQEIVAEELKKLEQKSATELKAVPRVRKN